jgi:hypothetical protein
MGLAVRSTGKRKRDLESQSSEYDGDTIFVLPRQAAAVQTIKKRGPLSDSKTQANVTRRRTASRVEGTRYCSIALTQQTC